MQTNERNLKRSMISKISFDCSIHLDRQAKDFQGNDGPDGRCNCRELVNQAAPFPFYRRFPWKIRSALIDCNSEWFWRKWKVNLQSGWKLIQFKSHGISSAHNFIRHRCLPLSLSLLLCVIMLFWWRSIRHNLKAVISIDVSTCVHTQEVAYRRS